MNKEKYRIRQINVDKILNPNNRSSIDWDGDSEFSYIIETKRKFLFFSWWSVYRYSTWYSSYKHTYLFISFSAAKKEMLKIIESESERAIVTYDKCGNKIYYE